MEFWLHLFNGIFITFKSFLVPTVIASLVAIYFTNKRHKQDLLDKLDSKSGWRKELFELSFKSQYTIDDAYKLLSFIRFQPHVKPKTNFDKATKLIYDVMKEIIKSTNSSEPNIEKKIYEINKLDKNIQILISSKIDENYVHKNYSIIIDSFIKYLLTHQWEYLQLTYKKLARLKCNPFYKDYRNKEDELLLYLYEAIKTQDSSLYEKFEIGCCHKKLESKLESKLKSKRFLLF